MNKLDRPGIFRAIPVSWSVIKGKETKSVGLAITYKILAQLVDPATDEWDDWTKYDEHEVSGAVWIVGKDGSVSEAGVKRLAESLGWDGDPASIPAGPPQTECQIEVAYNNFKGREGYIVQWLNPLGGTQSYADVTDLSIQYGAEMRAAASAVLKENGIVNDPVSPKKKAPPRKAPPRKSPPVTHHPLDRDGDLGPTDDQPASEDDLPF